MYEQYRTLCPDEQASSAVDREGAGQLVKQLDQVVAPFLLVLDACLDSRLVRTLVNLVVSLVHRRHREAGVLLWELGAMLLSPQQGPAGSKRIERLLHSPNWGCWLIEQVLWRRAHLHLQTLQQRGETALLLQDGSEIEPPESVRAEGLWPVRWAKGRRLSRPHPKMHGVSPTAGAPILVPGIHWHAAVLIGLKGLPCVAKMRSWPSRYHGLDEPGVERKAWERARGKRDSMQGKLWWAKFHRELQWTVKLRRVKHAAVPGTRLFLVVASAKPGDSPWYLLTNEPLERVEDALRMVPLYRRRWQIESSFRFEKSELGIEHIGVREGEAPLKFLAIVTLVYAFLLWLLECEGPLLRRCLLERWDHQTGKRARQSVQPLYPVRRALARLSYCYRPQLHDRVAWLFPGPLPATPNFCSSNSGYLMLKHLFPSLIRRLLPSPRFTPAADRPGLAYLCDGK